MAEAPDLKIGSIVWRFDESRRVYPPGHRGAGPIFREHFVPCDITSETMTTWIVGNGKKSFGGGSIPKNPKVRKLSFGWLPPSPDRHENWYLSLGAIEDACFIKEHAHYIAYKVEHMPADILRKIAEIIGYTDHLK